MRRKPTPPFAWCQGNLLFRGSHGLQTGRPIDHRPYSARHVGLLVEGFWNNKRTINPVPPVHPHRLEEWTPACRPSHRIDMGYAAAAMRCSTAEGLGGGGLPLQGFTFVTKEITNKHSTTWKVQRHQPRARLRSSASRPLLPRRRRGAWRV